MSFERLEPKQAREAIPVNSKEELIKQAPALNETIEKLVDPELTEEEFVKTIHEYNANADTPKADVKRYSLTIENGRTLEVCVDDDRDVGLNYKL